MKSRYFAIPLVSLLLTSIFLIYGVLVSNTPKKESPEVFVGIDVAYDDGLEPNNVYTYGEFIFWNGTVINP